MALLCDADMHRDVNLHADVEGRVLRIAESVNKGDMKDAVAILRGRCDLRKKLGAESVDNGTWTPSTVSATPLQTHAIVTDSLDFPIISNESLHHACSADATIDDNNHTADTRKFSFVSPTDIDFAENAHQGFTTLSLDEPILDESALPDGQPTAYNEEELPRRAGGFACCQSTVAARAEESEPTPWIMRFFGFQAAVR